MLTKVGWPEEFDHFWDAAKSVINQQALQAADDRRQTTSCHLALAMSTEDFVQKVEDLLTKRFPDEMPPIP